MTRRHWITLITILVLLLVQLGIPTMQFFQDGVNRWGWQMYSRQQVRPEMTVVRKDGTRQGTSLSDYLVVFRSEIRITDDVLAQICDRLPDSAETIELRDEETDAVTVYPCDP